MTKVHKCANPLCNRYVTVSSRSSNRSGTGEYCSRECVSLWSPRMREAASQLDAANPIELGKALRLAINKTSFSVTAMVLNISNSTLSRWLEETGKLLDDEIVYHTIPKDPIADAIAFLHTVELSLMRPDVIRCVEQGIVKAYYRV